MYRDPQIVVWLMDVEAAGEELGAEVEGVRNRLSFLQHNPTPGYVALDQEKAGDGVTSSQGPDNAASTPFDALFLTLYFVQIYVLQLILTLVIVIWTFLDADDLEHDVLLSLDCFAVALLCVEVFAGLMAKGGEFFADWGGRIDAVVAVFSVLALATYFAGLATAQLDVDQDKVAGLEWAHYFKFLRDAMRYALCRAAHTCTQTADAVHEPSSESQAWDSLYWACLTPFPCIFSLSGSCGCPCFCATSWRCGATLKPTATGTSAYSNTEHGAATSAAWRGLLFF